MGLSCSKLEGSCKLPKLNPVDMKVFFEKNGWSQGLCYQDQLAYMFCLVHELLIHTSLAEKKNMHIPFWRHLKIFITRNGVLFNMSFPDFEHLNLCF